VGCKPAVELALSRVQFPVTVLGPGRRAAIWVQGCSIHCAGCASVDTWHPGRERTPVSEVMAWLRSMVDDGGSGLTISGGEPFDQAEGLLALLGTVRAEPAFAALDVLVYSGYASAALRRRHSAVLALIDALISEPYLAGRPTDLPWRGSDNQRLTLLSARGVERFTDLANTPRSLQISTAGDQLWITGVPRRGDLDRLQELLAEQGVSLEDVSWRQ
jgi:anaerobic ribonucleoside-triphosphate reductase activating protein